MENRMETRPKSKRYWEVDAIRGISLVGMVFFHTFFLLGVFNVISTSIWEWICNYIWLGTSIFVVISGVSLILRHGRMKGSPRKEYYLAIVKRGVEVILIGVGIAIVASIFIHFVIEDGRYMYFNFLQMMGWCMILSIPFLRFGKWNIIPAIAIIILGLFLETLAGPAFLMPLGILPTGFMPRDFFPILPWLGVMLLGVALGSILYPNGFRRFNISDGGKIGALFAKIGKYPLQIYILHLPIVGGIILLLILITTALGCPIGHL